jgi:phosphoglycolate phosphatase
VAPALVVFDLDGTLIESDRDVADSANATLEAFGRPALPREDVVAMIGEGARVLIDRAFAQSGVPVPADAMAVFFRLYDERLFRHTRPYPGVPAVLAALSTRARVAILTNKPQHPSDRLAVRFGFDRHVFRVIGGDGAFPRKPDPAGLHALMAEAGAAPPATLMVGDSWIDHETASRAGVRICLARYGFGFRLIPQGRLRGDELVIDRPEQVLEVGRAG